ncbi:hypothetical protein H1R20_g13222, partial [Candolleomyces eurysporus]
MPYHYYIPRFILRGFILRDFIPEETTSSEPSVRRKKQRQREARRATEKGRPDPETISVFSLRSRLIESVPIATSFGVINFYHDASNQADLERLEKKLFKLEGKAARVIRELHIAAGHQTFTLPRSDLELLRKFIFLMHYRSSAIEKTYFQEDHPRNAPIRQWIRYLKVTKGYTTEKEIWLDGLRYYLFTHHSDIISHAKQYPIYGPSHLIGETNVDVPSHQSHALAYESFINNNYLGIWRSHEDSEFVLGNNSYGIWEGTLAGSPGLFKIYVISPKIAIVLKLNMSKTLPAIFEESTLSDHPLGFPQTVYHRGPDVLENRRASPKDQFDALQRHLESPNSDNDQITFRVNKLTVDQTYLVNQVVLENLGADGSLLFASRDAMLSTAQRYDTPEGPSPKQNRRAIARLIKCLESGESGSLSRKETFERVLWWILCIPVMLLSAAACFDMPFHHYLPQFILRGFVAEDATFPGPSVRKSKKQRQREARKARKKDQPDPETVLAFNMGSRLIESVPIATAFGVMNFCQDVSDQEDLEKLSELEREAARIIRDLHIAAGRQSTNQTFTLPRSDLQLLRKFIFLMHYRSSAPERTYYQENHPRNALIRHWIRHLKITTGYTTNREIWLDGLHYYLSTKHSDILNHAKQCSNYEPINLIGETNVDIPSYQWHALAYESFNDKHYLGIWKSHEDSEFVLGNNCYGVWEGTLAGSPLLYRIYVISPKVTIVLKLNMSKTLPSELEDSTLSDHPLGFPQTAYHRGPGALGNILASSKDQIEALQRHLKSPNSDNDQFTFSINQLTVNQTYLVNQIVLENLDPDGLLVFTSRHTLLSTAQRYDSPEWPFWKQNREAIAELVKYLKSRAGGSLTSNVSEPGASTPALGNTTSSNPTFVGRFQDKLGFEPSTEGGDMKKTGAIEVKDGEFPDGETKMLVHHESFTNNPELLRREPRARSSDPSFNVFFPGIVPLEDAVEFF